MQESPKKLLVIEDDNVRVKSAIEQASDHFKVVNTFKDFKISDLKGQKRQEGEEYKEYKLRLKVESKFLKLYKRGRRA